MNMENQPTNEQALKCLEKPTELGEDIDYRGIGGSASLNAKTKEIDLEDSAANKDDQDLQNPLIRGI